MKKWISSEQKCVENLLEDATIPYHLCDDASLVLHDLGLPTIINMFCERGKAFNSENFKRDMASSDSSTPTVSHVVIWSSNRVIHLLKSP